MRREKGKEGNIGILVAAGQMEETMASISCARTHSLVALTKPTQPLTGQTRK